jgi:ABC-2 type transport system permease protein
MNQRLTSQIVKELLSFVRDPRSRIALVGPPLIQLFILSFAITLEVQHVDIAVYDQDDGRWSEELLARIEAAGFVDRLVGVDRAAGLETLIDRREVLLAIDVPADFSRRLDAGDAARVQVIVDGRRGNAGQIALGYLETIAAGLGAELVAPHVDTTTPTVIRHWFNPNLAYQWFVVPSLSGMLAMMSSIIVTALSIARERELGTFDQLLVSPATAIEIVIGKTVPALAIGSLLGGLMITAGIFAFQVPFTGSVALLIGCLLLFILSVVGIGLAVSSLCQTQQQAILGTFTVVVPVILISGFATPVENMPQVLQWLAEASPLKHFLVIVQGTFLKAMPPADVFANAWPLAVIALVTLSVALLFVSRRLE